MRRQVPDVKNPYLNDKWTRASFSYTAEASDVRVATITLKNAQGGVITAPAMVDFYFSTSSVGANIAAATSGVIAGGASGNAVPVVAGRTGTLVTTAGGIVTLTVTDTAVRSLYICLRKPDGGVYVSPVLAFA